MQPRGLRAGELSGLLVAAALVAACSNESPTATVPPSSAAQVTAHGWAGRGTLAAYDGRAAGGKHTTYVVGFSDTTGLTAKVLAKVTTDARAGLPAPACPAASACGGPIDPPSVSTTKSNIYVLVGDASVESLGPDGSLTRVRTIPGTPTNRAAFAVSPDDAQIAVGVIDFASGSSRVFVEKLRGGGHVDVVTSPAGIVYWPVAWHGGQIVLASGRTYGGTVLNPYSATGYALVDPVAGTQPTALSSPNCVPTGLLSPAGTACVSNPGAHCLGALVSQSGPYSYYSSCLRRLDWSGKETVFLLPDYYQTSSMVANPAALSPNGKALITDWLFVALEPDARGFGGNQFVLGYGNPSSEQDVGWIDSNHVTWSFKYPDGSAAQRIIRLGDDYASASNVDYDGYPEVAGAPQSPVTGHLVATVPESL